MVITTPSDLPRIPLSPSLKQTFASLPWCLALLSEPNIQILAPPIDRPVQNTREESLLAETFATPSTIPVWQVLYRPPPASGPSNPEAAPYGEFLFLATVGSGINGHVDTMHGGVISLLFDEAMGQVAVFHRSPDTAGFTATMTVDYKKPVPTPGTILLRVWLEQKSQGRKAWVRGVMEDGKGTVYSTGTSLFVEVPLQKL